MQEYLENGMKLGWLIDLTPPSAPLSCRRGGGGEFVEIYRIGKEVEILKSPTELSGEDILPDFILNLSRIWG
ncbi:hypothetical protein CFPU101_03160 [Chroococcus sp. FPU101]|nr:hypothetical protein CFPU101_03160 [Chroococcus sp. FPU101]